MATISSVISPVVQLMTHVIEVINNNDDNPQTLQIDLRAVENLVQELAALFRGHEQQAPPEIVMFWLQLLQNSLSQVKRLLNRRLGRGQRFVDCVVCKPRRFSKEVTYWNSFFNHLYHGFQGDLSMLLTSLHFLSTKPLFLSKEDATGSGRIRDAQRLSEDDGWMLFRRVAFKEEHVSMDIEDRGRLIAAECKGMPLAINMVAAAMIGQRSVDEWDNCLSSIRSVADTSTFAATHPDHLDAQLYKFFRWSYDALPNSNLKNCFLYSAMYQQDLENGNPTVYGSRRAEGVDSRELVEMWIGEGLVKSQQGTHIMDMAIGRNYIKLLVQRCFFHIVNQNTDVCRGWSNQIHDVFPSIRVAEGIREMAMDIAQKEGKFLVMRSPDLRNLQEDQYENCRRISFADNSIGDLPTNFRCPNLASLILTGKTGLKELPSGFLLFLTSLTVLNLSGCNQITSIPTLVGQLRQLEFLSLSGLSIRDLPQEISRLSKLQFLNLSGCDCLVSLPSQIGELKNLKHLNLWGCDSLKTIPREISQLTSLCRLQIWTDLSVEMEAPASIWSLKGLKNLTELAVWVDNGSGIKDGIMGTWSEMRHLSLIYLKNDSEENLPQDVQNMKKLQSFMLWYYKGLNLPNCKFAHLEMVRLYDCTNIRELTPLERLPNLKILKLYDSCSELRELGIGSGGSVGYPRLQKLVLKWLEKLESLCGASNRGVWDEGTLPHLRVLKIGGRCPYEGRCPSLKRFPSGMEKLQNLSALVCSKDQWESMMWEDDNMRVKLQNILKHPY